MQNVSLELPWNSSEINLIQTLPLKKNQIGICVLWSLFIFYFWKRQYSIFRMLPVLELAFSMKITRISDDMDEYI